MDLDDLEELATKLHGKGSHWDLFQTAAGAGLVLYAAWAGSLALGIRKVFVQVPFVPSSAKQVSNMMSLLKGRSGKLVDLGSGDGRIVLEAYKQGFRPVVGYELNRLLWQLSHFRAWRAGCYGKVFFRREDFWKADLSDCSNLTVFLAPSVVPLLERKLLSKLPDEACVVAARFPFTWTPSRDAGESLERAWAYNIKDVRQAKQDTAGGGPAKE
ncbi:adenine nucleotide translocase lysine N-methyltransferase-like isoform X2 [Sceloporus undulatus]|uniref:adenine nucleotide translocase lysine N-methyltransferase-like isoform X2 n=1 Tax=Sceloporus undulatus TaxID=8520 RepID=UPI001C4B659F|nr:adenine nucleotide translocase lysine N-methyltransferase-like isoform X2 [Sceloporus undulatus]